VSAAAAPDRMLLRVTLADTWMPLALDASADETVADVKVRALASGNIPASQADAYEVKRGGVRVADESASLGAIGALNGTALIVLARRRRPVR
jgi:hypothetical protein